MKVSVIICTYSIDRYDAFTDAVAGLLSQTYDDVEVILVVDGTDEVYQRALDDFGHNEQVVVHCNEQNVGNMQSINNGIELASGDIIANMDDDARPAEDWIEQLLAAYENDETLAAGGKIEPEWVAGEAWYIPEEFYWLIGATHRGFSEDAGEVRNTFGSNLSFRSEVLEELGGYPTDDTGRTSRFQAGETELCARLQRQYGKGVYYQPDAVVYHKVFRYRKRLRWLHRRAFWQGVSKRWMEVAHQESTSRDRDFVWRLMTKFVPQRLRGLVTNPSRAAIAQLLVLLTLFAATGLGYTYGFITRVGNEQ